MKKILLFALCTIVSSGMSAQESESQKSKFFLAQIEYTGSIGLGSTASSYPFSNRAITFNLGLDLKKNIFSFFRNKTNVYGLVGAHFTQRGGRRGNSFDEWLESGNRISQIQFNFPIHVGFRFQPNDHFRIFLDFGPYFGINGGFPESYELYDYKIESYKYDFGIGGMIGLCFGRFGLSIGADKGFMDIAKYTSSNMRVSELKSDAAYFMLQWTFNKQ